MSEWTRPAQRIHCVVEMDKPLTIRRERWALVEGDKNANTIEAEVFQTTGKPFDLTGCTVTLTFVRPDKLAAPPMAAEVKGNVATATLTDACYRVSGRYHALMQIAKGGTDRTILWLVGDVLANESDGIVDEEGVFPTPEELMIIFQQVEQAKQAADAAASGANGAANSANTAASRANQAASAIENITASATGLETGAEATATVTEVGGAKHFSFGIPRGEKGDKGDPGTIENITVTSINGLPEALAGKQPIGNYLPNDGTAVNAEKLDGKAPEYYLQPRNLLDNSWFGGTMVDGAKQEMVAQAGFGEKHGTTLYLADRWKCYVDSAITPQDGCVTITKGKMWQRVSGLDAAKIYTFAAKGTDGNIRIAVGNPLVGKVSIEEISFEVEEPPFPSFGIGQGSWVWAALYEGEYTADNLPPYVYKGYAAELMECQRYYQISSLVVMANESGFVPMSIAMRVIPDIECQVLNGTGKPTATAHSTKIIQVTSRDSYAAIKAIINADL